MVHGSLFSGIGGFDLASKWMGWENAFHCEWEDFPRKVLQYHFPESQSYGDINETDFTIWNGKIDILTGGFPCQPYSAAGKRLGKEDERHLWPEMLRAIREIEPRWVIGENVYGLISWNEGLVFEEVQVDLENEGYEVQPYILPAAAVNAPHRRDRVWFVAYSDRIGHRRDTEENGHDTSDKYRRILQGERHDRHEVWGKTQRRGAVVTDTDLQRVEERYISTEPIKQGFIGGTYYEANATNAKVAGSEGQCIEGQGQEEPHGRSVEVARSRWDSFPTQPPVCRRDDGIPRELDSITFPKWRSESIKAYGNAIVPQVALQLFKTIHRYEQSQTES